MIKLENTSVYGWEAAIRGMRNPMNSWDKSDTLFMPFEFCDDVDEMNAALVCGGTCPMIGENDLKLMKNLSGAGSDHGKFLRMLTVTVDVTSSLYWWKEFDTYKVGTVANSCSTMHKIQAKEFTIDDFSTDRLTDENIWLFEDHIIRRLNTCRKFFIDTGDKIHWWQMIQLLPSSYNQKRTVQLNYQVLKNIYHARKNHKLDEWHEFCHWIESLPYSELITGKEHR